MTQPLSPHHLYHPRPEDSGVFNKWRGTPSESCKWKGPLGREPGVHQARKERQQYLQSKAEILRDDEGEKG